MSVKYCNLGLSRHQPDFMSDKRCDCCSNGACW